MRPLSSLRTQGVELEGATRALPERARSVHESVRIYLELHREMDHLLRASEEIFRSERAAHIAELQRRLSALNRSRP